MEKYRNLITWADHIIFIYPIWWGGMPAVLKGFIDRVFTAGFAYSYGKRGLIGHLQGKSAWIITTHNTPVFLTPFIQDYGKVLKNQVLKSCGIKPVTHTQLAGTENSSDEKRRRFLDKIANIAGSILTFLVYYDFFTKDYLVTKITNKFTLDCLKFALSQNKLYTKTFQIT